MGKYNGLKEHPDFSIQGARMTKYVTEIARKGKVITFIRGFPACPECDQVLNKDFIGARWVCCKCGTIYATAELIEALRVERAIFGTQVSVRGLED